MRDVSKHAPRGEDQTRNLFLLSHRSTHERSPQSKSVNPIQLLATKTGAPAAASASAPLRSAPSRTASPTGRPRYRHDRQLVTGGWHGLQGHAVARWPRLPRRPRVRGTPTSAAVPVQLIATPLAQPLIAARCPSALRGAALSDAWRIPGERWLVEAGLRVCRSSPWHLGPAGRRAPAIPSCTRSRARVADQQPRGRA
jgi:hypothetical protein